MQYDQTPGIGDSELTFVGILDSDFGVPHKPVSG